MSSKDRSQPHEVIPDALLEQVAIRFRALSSLSRLKVLNALMDGPQSMAQIMETTGLEQSNLSRHVRELEISGCLARERTGRSVRLQIVDPNVKELCELVCRSLRDRAAEDLRRLAGQ